MDSAVVKAFDQALLDLDTALRPVIGRPHATERVAVARDAQRRFLGTVAPYRLQLALADHQAAGEGRSAVGKEQALELLAKCLDLVEQSGATRTEIVALVNRETVEHSHD